MSRLIAPKADHAPLPYLRLQALPLHIHTGLAACFRHLQRGLTRMGIFLLPEKIQLPVNFRPLPCRLAQGRTSAEHRAGRRVKKVCRAYIPLGLKTSVVELSAKG